MDRKAVMEILDGYRSGAFSPDEAVEKLKILPYEDLEDIKIDHHRALRQGFPEVVFCPGKTVDQVVRAMYELARMNSNVLASRATQEIFERCKLCCLTSDTISGPEWWCWNAIPCQGCGPLYTRNDCRYGRYSCCGRSRDHR